jgi:hypothetical protein
MDWTVGRLVVIVIIFSVSGMGSLGEWDGNWVTL